MIIRYFEYVLLLGLLCCIGCTSEQRKSLESVPVAIGSTNEIVVVAEKDVWEGPIGDSLRYYFETPYIILPQPEPIFDLRHFTMADLAQHSTRKLLRTYLFLGDLSQSSSSVTQEVEKDLRAENVRRAKEDPSFSSTAGINKWAKGQLMIYLFGSGQQALIDNIRNNFPAIAQKIRRFDQEQVEAAAYVAGHNAVISNDIREQFGIQLDIPGDYKVAVEDDNFMWLRRETRHASNNIMLHKIPYTNKAQLSKEGIKAIRDSLGRQYITTEIEGAYMQINDTDLPLFVENVKLNGQFAIEARGIWDVENDFMGGAFISYLVLNPNTNELIFMDGFVHAPGKPKRDFMQQVTYVLKSLKL